MNRALIAFCLAGVVLMATGPSLPAAQEPCRATELSASKEPNIFTPAQENDLGDAIAERYEASLRVIDNPDLTARLREIGGRLVTHLPPTDLKIRFTLIDIPDANAFVLPGGRIYVSRKLVAFTRTEDELAGILGHELGHLVARQQTIQATRQFKEVLGVTAVGDRADIFTKYNRLMDNAARKPGAFDSAGREDREQIEADRLGLFIVAAAGYDPKAHVAFFDRYAATQGKTGTFLSKMFGTTNPDAKRLGDLVKNSGAVSTGCAAPADPSRADAYKAWQTAVASSSAFERAESLPGLVSRTALNPFRAEVTHLRFSPDGRDILAQDEAGITVLSRDPLAVLFRIDAPDAEHAEFSVDSRDVLLHTTDLRVERWSVMSRKLTEVHDIYNRTTCLATLLAPDGKTVACVDGDTTLSLIDVDSGEAFFQKKGFNTVDPFALFTVLLAGGSTGGVRAALTMDFSPDGRYFAAGSRTLADNGTLVYDLSTRGVLALKGPARRLLASAFTFVAADRLIGLNPDNPAKSGAVQLPAGEVVAQFALAQGYLDAPTRGNYVFLRPFQKYATGVLDLAAGRVVKGNATEAFDMFDDVFIAERGTGDLGLYAVSGNELKASVSLPQALLARIRTAAVSSNFGWVALSQRTRGVLWNTQTGERIAMVRDFDGAFIEDGGTLYADLPKAGADPRAIMRLDSTTRNVGSAGEIKERYAAQFGRALLVVRPLPPDTLQPTGVEFEWQDVRTAKPLWKKPYAKNPPDDFWPSSHGDAFVVCWKADSVAGREVIRQDPVLRSRVKLGDIAGDYVLEVLDGQSGSVRGRMLLETGKGSFHPHDIVVKDDVVLVTDSLDRVLVYGLASGEQQGYAFGYNPIVSTTGGVLAVENGSGRIAVYDLKTLRRTVGFTFSHGVALKSFSPDGHRLFVLTSDQQAQVLNVPIAGSRP